jgi:hypothetical protein
MRLTGILILFCLSVSAGFAQESTGSEPIRSGAVWLSGSIKFKPLKQMGISKGHFSKRFDMAVEWAHRSESLFEQTSSVFTDITTRYEVNDWLRAGVVYRHTFRDALNEDGNRFQLFAQTKREIGQFDASYKFRYQYNIVDVEGGRHVVRNKMDLEYRTKGFRINPVAAVETFTWFHYTGIHYVGIRYAIGGNINLPNGQEIDFGLKQDREIDVYEPTYRTIFALSYSYEF